jgi:hypothetical protein
MLRYVKDDDGVIHYVSDVNLLMNAERLRNQIGEESYLNLIRGIQPKKSPYDDKYTDEQLFTAIKSRFIQSPSEVLAWIESLGSAGFNGATQFLRVERNFSLFWFILTR